MVGGLARARTLVAALLLAVALLLPQTSAAEAQDVSLTLSRSQVNQDGVVLIAIVDATRTGSDDASYPVPFNDAYLNRVNVQFRNLSAAKTVTMRAVEIGPALNVYTLLVRVRETENAVTAEGAEVLPASDGDTIFVSYGSRSRILRMDLGPPVVRDLSPEDGAFRPVGMVSFSGEVTDSPTSFSDDENEIAAQTAGSGIIALTILGNIDIPGADLTFTRIAGGWRVLFDADLTSLEEGTQVPWSISATDRAGNINTVSHTLTLSAPPPAPATPTPTPTLTPTPTPTPVPSPTPTPSPPPTSTPTAILGLTPTPTPTPLSLPILDRTPTATATSTPAQAPTASATRTPSPVLAVAPQTAPPTPSPLAAGATTQIQATPTPTATPEPEGGGLCSRSGGSDLSLLLGMGALLGLAWRRRRWA